MNKKEEVRKNGGVFHIAEGDGFSGSTGLYVRAAVSPRMGIRNLDVTTAFHKPGMEFAPHTHDEAEELLFAHKGEGEFFLKDRWIPVKEGDIVYAPPGVMHGTRNPSGNTEDFVTLGIGSPPKYDLYKRVGYKLDDED